MSDGARGKLQPPFMVAELSPNTRKHYCYGSEAEPHGKLPLILDTAIMDGRQVYMCQCPRCRIIYRSKAVAGPDAPRGDNDWEGVNFESDYEI